MELKKITINKTLCYTFLIISAVILLFLLGFIIVYYLAIVSDIPPQPLVTELHGLEKMFGVWLLILLSNYLVLICTKNKNKIKRGCRKMSNI